MEQELKNEHLDITIMIIHTSMGNLLSTFKTWEISHQKYIHIYVFS